MTWDEALSHIAGKMQAIKARYGPEALALFRHGLGGIFLKRTLNAYGSPNIAAPAFAQCRGPRDVGFHLTFGEEVGSPQRTDIRNSRCLVLIGSHLGENMHNTQVQGFGEAARVIAPLNARLGSWGRTGGFYTPASMDVPGYPYPPYPKAQEGKVENPGGRCPFALQTLTTGIREATITG